MVEIGVGDRKRLLVVADDVASAEALREHLGRHGFAVAQATSPRAAARAARELAPDVVLVDAAVRGGWRDVVLALDGLVDRRRVAVLAAYWSAEARHAAREFGIGETLLKQLEGPILVHRLRRLAETAPAVDGREPGGPATPAARLDRRREPAATGPAPRDAGPGAGRERRGA
jgi:DNA-binding response OmpR family regulator